MASEKMKKRLAKKAENIKKNSSGGNKYKFFMFKEGTTRMRMVNVGEDEDFSLEVSVFYLGKDIGYVVSPSSFGMKCALTLKYEKLAKSKDEAERELAARMKPKRRFMGLGYRYKDEKGSEVDTAEGVKPILLTNGQAQDLIDYFLDEEQGDFTHPLEGFDIKFKRTGKTQMDTEYGTVCCKPTKAAKEFRGPYDLEEEVKKIMPSYEETKEIVKQFLTQGVEDEDDEDEKPKNKKKSRSDY